MFDCWADPVVHLLLPTQELNVPAISYDKKVLQYWSQVAQTFSLETFKFECVDHRDRDAWCVHNDLYVVDAEKWSL